MKILIPMDFTLVASNAFRYAFNMYPEAEITCLYCMPSNLNHKVPAILKINETRSSRLTLELKNIILDVIDKPSLPDNVKLSVKIGEAVNCIKETATELNPDLIFMGTRDKYDIFDKWLGTITTGVVKSVNYPTYLIPRHAKFSGIDKTLVATDEHMQSPLLLNWLKRWNKEIKSFVKFLHVQLSEKRKIENISEGIVNNLFEEDNVGFAFEIENVKSEDLGNTLLSKAYNLGADLIIAAPDKQSLLQSLLYKSTSKDLILRSKIPLLFLKFS